MFNLFLNNTIKVHLTLTQRAFWVALKWGFWTIIGLSFLLIAIDIATGYWVRDRIYTDINKLPNYQTAVVLGTAKYYTTGTPNLYYKYRIETTRNLIKQGKVQKLLVSGDNKTPYYNEPRVMTNDLRNMGVQAVQIQQDFAGYRTLDSIIRADKVFRLPPFIVISQRFHCERAMFIAKTRNIDAVCFIAKYPEGHFKVRIREFFARAGMVLDYLLDRQPAVLEKIIINS
ncbi:SanA/YdcF family protein [Haemophilus parahaemolyticus]|uniref:SanA/YdcF family protein n=1 Tax=Haemophilus parahaemolyticus TaxID=735 RepID=UPI0026F1EA4A|nr:ElyC/SanA/YdcF family protein [Haemophilus parahaemolyticus]